MVSTTLLQLLYYTSSSFSLSPSEAEKVKQVAQIQFDQKVMEKDKQMEMSRIEDLTKLARLKAQADADYYTAQKMSDANKVLGSITPCLLYSNIPHCYNMNVTIHLFPDLPT